GCVQLAVFRVTDLSDPKKRFKIDVNAQQRYITGAVLMCNDPMETGLNLVLVEGGAKALKAYVKLMTKRIRWGEEDYEAEGSDSD
ncbi:unnamed protein product, partial [Discosporangium mesarthrocarpum]